MNKILECKKLLFRYFWDIAGIVPDESNDRESLGDLPPEVGVDVTFYSLQINYGSWTDKHRILLQTFFFPWAYQDEIKTPPLKPGDQRIASELRMNFYFVDESTWRIPIRETSKVWLF